MITVILSFARILGLSRVTVRCTLHLVPERKHFLLLVYARFRKDMGLNTLITHAEFDLLGNLYLHVKKGY